MKIPLIIFTLCFISFIKGLSDFIQVKNVKKNIASAGVVTYDTLRSKVYFTYLHKDFKNDILNKFDEEKYENQRVDIDWNAKTVHAYYLKRIYLPDRWHELYYFYSVSVTVNKFEKKKECKRVGRQTICKLVDHPKGLDKRDVEFMKNKGINSMHSSMQVEFASTVDDSYKEQFYAQYPNLRK